MNFQLCVGTSIAIIVPTNVRSFLAHRDRGAVMMDVVRAWTIPAVIGVAVGARRSRRLRSAAVLKLCFVAVGSVIAVKMLVRPRRLADCRRPAGPGRHDRLWLLSSGLRPR